MNTIVSKIRCEIPLFFVRGGAAWRPVENFVFRRIEDETILVPIKDKKLFNKR